MSIPVSIEDLLHRRKVESNRIEFKKGWNPEKIYRTICAFANDFDNIGGGYIIVGVDEENGIAKRPVYGLKEEQIDSILKEMTNLNNKISPNYLPRTEIADIDGKQILAIWCPSGLSRPYDVPENVLVKHSQRKPYIRSGSTTIEPKGDILIELRDLANHIPFDDRGNPEISVADISPIFLYDYLQRVGSKLVKDFNGSNIIEILEQMDLLTGPKENRLIKNVAAMMFCPNLTKFFPFTQVEIVMFPSGVLKDPNNMIEFPIIKGTVVQMIEETLRFFRTTIIKEHISKQREKAESLRFRNYPYQALEEAIVNAFYHRDYSSRQPVVIEIQPQELSIWSASGPNWSISNEAISSGTRLFSRFYRNRRLGEFLKELGLTEGRSTGVPTIQNELKQNGSKPALFETDQNRSFFNIIIPCHVEAEGIPLTALESISNKETEKSNKETEKSNKETEKSNKENDLSEIQRKFLYSLITSPDISFKQIAETLGVSVQTVRTIQKQLAKKNIKIQHIGSTKKGTWTVDGITEADLRD